MATRERPPKLPIVLDSVVPDGEVVRDMARSNGPYWQPGRMLATTGASKDASADAAADMSAADTMVGPVFRGDWAFGEPLVADAEQLLHHAGFRAAAGSMYDTEVVVPEQVYINLTTPIGRQGFSHTDIPEFRGVDRSNAPAWLLTAMGQSRCFEDERIHIVTAVAWFYRGEAGGLRYWPTGMDGASVLHDDMWNTAVVGDNDFMPHEVQRVGPRGSTKPEGMTIDSQLRWTGARWEITKGTPTESGDTDADAVLAEYDDHQVRLSVSWKAKVFADRDERRKAETGTDAVTIPEALDRLAAALASSDQPEDLAGDDLSSRALRDQLNRRFSAYAISSPPG